LLCYYFTGSGPLEIKLVIIYLLFIIGQIGKNPIQTAGCYGILKSIQENPDSAMETLDFSDITVNQDFEELHASMKEILPALVVKHGGRIGTLKKAKYDSF
uniref:Uncharacterized protein n=1 Tax=Sphaeramia orbicularis TaxID=375764 RepID=A0A672YJ88_9TELE